MTLRTVRNAISNRLFSLEEGSRLWNIRRRTNEFIERLNPTWIHVPTSLQIDTHNYCNNKCIYCNVREGGAFNIPRGRMPTEMVEYIIRYWGKFREMRIIAPFMNGEPLLDKRMPRFFDLTAECSHAYNLLDTNGTVYENREMLLHPNLRVVRFTISANSRETYKKVHGVNLFSKALKTFWWFADHKAQSQRIQLHFIVTKNNEHEIEDWIERFKGYTRKIFPLHRMLGIQNASEQALGTRKDYIHSASSFEEWKQTRPLFIYPNDHRERNVIPKHKTCQGMSFAVQWDGTIMHCTDAPPTYNYGHCYETDMLTAWHLRNKARITNPACLACNAKRPDWKETLKKYVI